MVQIEFAGTVNGGPMDGQSYAAQSPEFYVAQLAEFNWRANDTECPVVTRHVYRFNSKERRWYYNGVQ